MAKKAAPKAAEPKPAPAPAPPVEKTAAKLPKPAPAPAPPLEKTGAKLPKPATKADVLTELSGKTGLSKKDVDAVFVALGDLIEQELGKKGPGLFTIPGLLKLKVTRKPAAKARQGTNPFTGEPMTIKAKPASNAVKAQALKALKDRV